MMVVVEGDKSYVKTDFCKEFWNGILSWEPSVLPLRDNDIELSVQTVPSRDTIYCFNKQSVEPG
jgi:hypothetical protein